MIGTLGPDVPFAFSFDQLDCRAYGVPEHCKASLYEVVSAQYERDLCGRSFSIDSECGVPRGSGDIGETRQIRGQIFRQRVGKEAPTFTFAKIGWTKHSNDWSASLTL